MVSCGMWVFHQGEVVFDPIVSPTIFGLEPGVEEDNYVEVFVYLENEVGIFIENNEITGAH